MTEAPTTTEATVTPTPAANQLPDEAHAVALAEKAMADKINAQAQVPTTPNSSQPPQPTEEKPPEDPATKRLSFLAKKEQEILRQRREAQQAISEVRQLRAQIEQERAQYQDFFRNLQEDPLKALAGLGLTYDKLTDAQIQGKPADTTALQLQQLKQEQEAFRQQVLENERLKAEQEAQQAQAQADAVIDRFKQDIQSYVDQNKDAYEMIALNEAQEHIFETAQAYFERTGKTLKIKEAADMVEEYLVDRAKKLTASKKLQTKPTAPPADPGKTASKTLTNTMSPGVTSSTSGLVSEGEAIRRALANLGRS